ncbi:dihydrofolate reductase [Halobacteriovorax sp. HLS]|uniref:dihydrofolate reductase n=1 Tax=Halobacteriovorax sp. HLS TaxID=2234000 RepID=UPI0013E2C681|nr:dihydrofolate reductase [Halobacteriovorax sp. HLS]
MKYIIVAGIGNEGELGLENKLLWRLPEDLKNFKSLTINKTMVMGRKTFESIGKALPNRETIILTRDKSFKASGCKVFHHQDDIDSYAKENHIEELMIVGGGEIYNLYLPRVCTMYISHVDYSGASDTRFPLFDSADWSVEQLAEYGATPKTLAWKLCKYSRKL